MQRRVVSMGTGSGADDNYVQYNDGTKKYFPDAADVYPFYKNARREQGEWKEEAPSYPRPRPRATPKQTGQKRVVSMGTGSGADDNYVLYGDGTKKYFTKPGDVYPFYEKALKEQGDWVAYDRER